MRSLLPDPVIGRARQLVIGEGWSVAAAHRAIVSGADGSEPYPCTYPQIKRAVSRARSKSGEPAPEITPAAMGRRILRLLERELARIEADRKQPDLERLDRIAKTLRTLEPLRSSPSEKRASSLQRLIRQETEESPPIGALAEPRSEPHNGQP